jgi:hypothetical protein
MFEQRPTEDELRGWHRRFAVEANDRVWTLTEKLEVTSEERTELSNWVVAFSTTSI